MKIAHVVEAAAGGVLTYLRHVLPALRARGCKVVLIWSRLREDPQLDAVATELRRKSVEIREVPMQREVRPGWDLRAFWRLVGHLRSDGFDLVHSHASKAGVLGRLAAGFLGLPVVHTPHCFSFLRQSATRARAYLVLEKLMGRLSDRVAAVSEEEMRTAVESKLVPARRCVFINNALPRLVDKPAPDPREARRLLGLPEDRRIVSMAARLVPEKGVREFIDAARRSRSDALFVIAGDGPLASEARQAIASQGLERRVLLLGNVARMDALHAASDVAVLLSRAEGQSYFLLEAMQAGRGVVAADAPGIRGLIEHGRTGLLAGSDAGSPHEAVDRLLADEELRRRLGQAARQRVRRQHDLADQAGKLIAVYQACLLERRRSA